MGLLWCNLYQKKVTASKSLVVRTLGNNNHFIVRKLGKENRKIYKKEECKSNMTSRETTERSVKSL